MVALPSEVMMALLKAMDPPLVQTTSGAADWYAVIGAKSTTPDNHVVVYDTTGVKHGRLQGSGENVIGDGIQILVRGKTYPTGARKIKDIQDVLSGVKNFEVTVGLEVIMVLALTLTTPWTFAGNEENNARKLFTINWRMALR